jgi:hypothetical protein
MFVPLRTECALTWNQMARQMMSPLCTFYAYCLMSNHMHLLIQEREKTRRNVVLRSALSIGTGIRQLSRLTGISYGVIQKLKNDQENRPR